MTNKCLTAIVTASIIMFSHGYASASDIKLPSDFEWGYYQYNDDGNKGRSTSELSFAIPETDAIAFRATCVAGSSGNFSVVKFAAGSSLAGMRDGDAINISFSTRGWQRTMRGAVIGTNAEYGISGVELIVDNDDRFWDVMRDSNSIDYSVRGNVTSMSLSGSGRKIMPFLDSCRFYAAQFENPKPVNTSPTKTTQQLSLKDDPRWATCDLEQNKRSLNSDTPVTVTFRNTSGEYRSVEWVGFDGQPKNYAALNPGEEYTLQTYLTHPWMFTDGPGNCIEIFQPQLGVQVFNIGAKSPGFGPE